MADTRKAEDSVIFVLNEFDWLRSAANNVPAGAEKSIASVRLTLNGLWEARKQLDANKTATGNLHDDLDQVRYGIYQFFSRYISFPVLPTSLLPSARSFNLNGPRSLEDIISILKHIHYQYSKFARKKKEKFYQKEKEEKGSSVPGDSVLIQGGDLVVFNRHKERLIKLLLKDDSGTKNVLVTGRRGSGKTTLVRKVCEDVQVRKHFGTIAWISVPPINDADLIRREILLQLLLENKAPVPDHLSASDGINEMLKPQIISLLQRERCLIVVDNLVDQCTLETFQSVSHLVETGRMIFIARHELGPRYSGTHQDGHQLKTYEMEDLSEEESWALFLSKTFPKGDGPSSLEKVCQDIVRKCERRPEAIVLFSRLLRYKGEKNAEWESSISPSDLSDALELIQQVLNIIYQEDGLGSCLLYLSIFPENSPLNRMRVSRLWTAEGFVNLERAESFLQELLDRKWIRSVETRSDGGLSTFQVDKLVREIIVSLSDHCNLLRITSEGSTNWLERVRHLSIQGTIKDLNALFESALLRYLRDTSIEVISRSIERVKHLEFLNLKQSLVTELPPETAKLKNIRHILIYHHEKDPLMESYNLIGFKASCTIRGFECLEKLCFVESDSSTLEDLGYLTKLRRLGITELREEHGKVLCSSLENLERLESLNLHASDEDEIMDLHHLSSPPVSLKHLYLHGRLNMLPNWISSLCHLTKIVLRWAAIQQEEDFLATLGKLPKLVKLELRRAYNGRQLDFKDGQFPKLKILLLDEFGRLRSMSLAEGTMPCLEDLTISRCPWLEGIPTGIEHIPTLQALEFFDMSREFYKMVPDDYRNSKGKPQVHLTQWRPGQWKTIPLVGIDEREEGFAGDTE